MENKNFYKGIEEIKKLKLSDREKALVLRNLKSHIEVNRSPWYSVTSYRWMYYSLGTVVLVFVLGLGGYSGVKNSLPGDSLYSLKVDVVEPIRLNMAVGEIAKASVLSENFSERLLEAEILANQGRLSDSNGQEIENRLIKHTENISIVLSSSPNPENSELSDAKADLEAIINSHDRILTRIEEKSKNKSSGNSISKIKNVISKKAGMANKSEQSESTFAQAMMIQTDETSTTTNQKDNIDFDKKKKDTEKVIETVKKNVEKARKGKRKVNRGILEDSSKYLLEAESALLRAKENKKSGDNKKAVEDLVDSRKRAKEADNALRVSRYIEDVED